MNSDTAAAGKQPATGETKSDVPAAGKRPPASRMAFNGTTGGLYRIIIGNFLLGILTLGIYTFWGRTRMRRYIAAHHIVAGAPFEYTGTGKQLLVGWLKAMVIVLPLLVGIAMTAETNPLLYIVFLLAFYLLIPLGIYLGLRFRMAHLKWRGIRFRLKGSVKTYAKITVKRFLADIFTLGYAMPKSALIRWNYFANNAGFGSLAFKYDPRRADLKRLQKYHLMSAYAPAAFLLLTGVMSSQAPGLFIVALFIFFFAITLGRSWYHAALWQEKLRGLALEDLRFKSTATGVEYLKLRLTNGLIVIFSLGLLYPLAMKRKYDFRARHLLVGGDLKALLAKQAELDKTSALGDMMDIDSDMGAGLDIGF